MFFTETDMKRFMTTGDIKRRVLIVDDEMINRELLSAILSQNYEIATASNGREAMDALAQPDADFSLILLDLLMPVMDGFEVIERCKADEHLRRIPIIVMTSEKSAEVRSIRMGAADFITKPYNLPEVILARCERIIELSEGRQLISAAEHDRLTMLYSRNFFLEYANRLYQYHPELHMDAIVMDIEQFHSVNDLNGREFGDNVLRFLGSEIRAFLTETEGIASRFEADRFEIYCAHQEDYEALLDHFQKKLNGISHNASIHLRMGVKPWQEGVDPIELFDRARAACNMVRGNYQTPLMVYDEDMRMRELLNHRLLNDLRKAVIERQLTVYYQPKYNIQCDPPRLSSAEALIRWKHPELGMISPGVFVPLFESHGLISVVDNFVWQEAARQVAQWKEKYQFTLPVSVNLSRADVFDPTLVDQLIRIIEENGLEYKNIKLEVTESAYTDNAKNVLDDIKKKEA